MPKLIAIIFYSLFFINVASARDKIENHQQNLFLNLNLTTFEINENSEIFYDENSGIILENIQSALLDLMSYSRFDNIEECQSLELQVFLLPRRILNNRRIMDFLQWSDWNNQDIRGVYTSFHVQSQGEIYINYEKSSREFYFTLAHEFFHFATDVECKRFNYTERDADNFATNFCESSDFC